MLDIEKIMVLIKKHKFNLLILFVGCTFALAVTLSPWNLKNEAYIEQVVLKSEPITSKYGSVNSYYFFKVGYNSRGGLHYGVWIRGDKHSGSSFIYLKKQNDKYFYRVE